MDPPGSLSLADFGAGTGKLIVAPQLQRRGALALPDTQSMIPQIDPAVAAMSQRASAQFASLGQSMLSERNAQQTPNAQDLRGFSASSVARSSNDDYAAMGFGDNVPRSLIGTESGGNWSAQNQETGAGGTKGHYGILQFGNARFSEAQAAGAVPQGMTIEQFGSDTPEGRQAQISASNWHFNDIDRRISGAGYDKMVGQSIGGVPITMDGMRSMAHLGGFGGLSKFINSGGGYNPSDSFGTSLAAYGQTHQ